LRPDRPGLANAHGKRQAWTCPCPWGRTGLDWSMPTGKDRPGLADAPGAGQV